MGPRGDVRSGWLVAGSDLETGGTGGGRSTEGARVLHGVAESGARPGPIPAGHPGQLGRAAAAGRDLRRAGPASPVDPPGSRHQRAECRRLGPACGGRLAGSSRRVLFARAGGLPGRGADGGRDGLGPGGEQRTGGGAGPSPRAAKASGADAVHPGYGFLAENAGFAAAVEGAGLTFIGPTPDQIRSMGDKRAARALAQQAGVPVVPGAEGADRAALESAVRAIGYPVMVKAALGGGGKGMRSVNDAPELAEAIDSAQRVAAAA